MRRALYLLIIFICNSLTTVAQTIENPVFDRTDIPAFHIDKVTINKEATIIQCSYAAEANSWANISEDTYLLDTKTNKKYPIQKSEGLPYGPEQRKFLFGERCEVILYFPSFNPQGKLDLIENKDEKAFNVYGIDLNNQFEKQYQESELKRFSNMASFYDSAGDTLKAIQYKEDELKATQFIYGVKSEAYSLSLLELSVMYDKFENPFKAIKLMEIDIKRYAETWGEYDKDYASLIRLLAEFYSHAKNYDLAINNYKKSIAIYEKLNITDEGYALTLGLIADAYYKIEDFDNGLLNMQKAVDVRRKLGDIDGYINGLVQLLIAGYDQDVMKRIEALEKELDNLPDFVSASSLEMVIIYKTLAGLYSYQHIEGNKERAIDYCNKSLDILGNTGGKTEEYAEILAQKCKYQMESGMKYEAIATGEASKQIFDSLNIKSGKYAQMLTDLAWVYGEVYDYERAINLETIAASIYESENDWMALADAYGHIGNYYHYSEDLDNAELYLKKAIETLEGHDDADQIVSKDKESIGYWNVADSNRNKPIKQYIGFVKSNYYSTLSNVFMKRGKLFDAILTTKEKGEILKEIDEESYAYNLTTLSHYYLQNKQFPEAINSVKQSIDLLKRVGTRAEFLVPSYLILGECYMNNSDIQQAKESFLLSLSMANDMRNEGIKISAASFLSSLYMDNYEYTKAEKLLSEILDNVQVNIKREIIGMTSEQKQRLWNRYEWLYLLYREIVEKSDRNEELYSKLYNYILFSKSLLLDAYVSDGDQLLHRMNIGWKDIQKKLSDQDIAIEIFTTREDSLYFTYHAMIIDKTCKFPNMVSLYNESMFEELKKNSTKSIMEIIGPLIWKPILSQYNNVENIYFSPDGIINRLPIEYCNVDGIGEMMNHYNLFRLSSTKEIVFQNKKAQEANAILYGGLNYETQVIESTDNDSIKGNSLLRSINARGGFDPLFSALEEVQEIDSLLKNKNILSTLYTDEKGTEESFKKLSGKDVNMIHLSTHGMYIGPDIVYQKKIKNNFNFLELITNEKDPVQEDIVLTHSFLVMSGGNKLIYRKTIAPQIDDDILTAFEISQLDLRKVDMVVLSACETGLGDINSNGIYGLQRGFKKAGVNTILMSLDKVDDEATKLLMVEFYKNLMDGKSKHQSLKDAQKYLRQVDNGKYDKPEYWASFILLDGIN